LRNPVVFLKNPVKGGLPRFAMLPIFRRGDMRQFVREYFNACRNGISPDTSTTGGDPSSGKVVAPQAAPPLPSSTSGTK